MTERLWAAVDALTKPTRVRFIRSVDRVSWPDWGTVPSLWEQLAAETGTGRDGQSGGGRGMYRTPVAIDCLQLAADISDTIVDALKGHEVKPRMVGKQVDVPAAVRQLASAVVTAGDQDLTDWWTYRVQSWCRQIRTTLRLTDDPQPRRMRDTACVTCRATHVTEMVDGELQRVPALLIDFADGMVRAVTCSACGDIHWRGDDLHELAALIGRDTPTTPATRTDQVC